MAGPQALIEHLISEDRYPILFFLFSRAGVERNAGEMAERLSLLREEDVIRVSALAESLPEQVRRLHPALVRCLPRGIGFHHAGLLPAARQAVEELFVRGYLPVVFCTETFALGVNFPARTVVLGAMTKRDDQGYRQLLAREVLQISGRAGRRGTDQRGYAYFVINPAYPEETPATPPEVPEAVGRELELTPGAVLRLTLRYEGSRSEIKRYFANSFAAFRLRRQREELEVELQAARRELQRFSQVTGCPAVQPDSACAAEVWRRRASLEASLRHEEAILTDAARALRAMRKPRRRSRQQARADQASQRVAKLRQELAGLPEPGACPHAGAAPDPAGCPAFDERRSLLQHLRSRLLGLRRMPDPAAGLWRTFARQRGSLSRAGFIQEGLLADKGRLALAAGPGGVFFAEILSRIAGDPRPADLASWAAGSLCESDERKGAFKPEVIRSAAMHLRLAGLPVMYSPADARALLAWAQGAEVAVAAETGEIAPGDFVALARRVAETLRGSAQALPRLEAVLWAAHGAVWRDEVADVFGTG